tara:strand:- start:743 stop:871 length:129 start_codon:yes stop_codon:yes gene_type:complete
MTEPEAEIDINDEVGELDWLTMDDDTPLTCGIENPDICESCQ